MGAASSIDAVAAAARATDVFESLKPGVETTVVEDPGKLKLLGRVTAFYRRMDEAAAVNLTQH